MGERGKESLVSSVVVAGLWAVGGAGRRGAILMAAGAVGLTLGRVALGTVTLTNLAVFDGNTEASPAGVLYLDAAGNLFGTTAGGGTSGGGTVFEVSGTTPRTVTTLVSLSGIAAPVSGLIADAAGNLYGTTRGGGNFGYGSVFELTGTTHQTLTTLFSFNNDNGNRPQGSLMLDGSGNLYGVTSSGGPNRDGTAGNGTVFELSGINHQTLTTLVAFTGANGSDPFDGLVADAGGNLYGTTMTGGTAGYGTAFKLSGATHQTLTTLQMFTGPNGQSPLGRMYADAAGNLFGTAGGGGGWPGTVFELSGTNHQTLTTLATFNGANGQLAKGGLIADALGNLFGTTQDGGAYGDYGTVFELSGPNHQTMTTLYSFSGADGWAPLAGLTADSAGNLYGTTYQGGGKFGATGWGTVFELSGTGFVAPEPGSLLMLVLGGAGILSGRRRRLAAER